jgi:hypothetical protein
MSVDVFRPKNVAQELNSGGPRVQEIDLIGDARRVDFKDLILRARDGDPHASDVLYGLTTRIVTKGLRTRGVHMYGSGVVEDLTAVTVAQVFTDVIDRYDVDLPVSEDTPSEEIPDVVRRRYISYVGQVARSRLADQLKSEGRAQIPVYEVSHHDNVDATEMILSQPGLRDLLTPEQQQVVDLRTQGMSVKEVSQEVGISVSYVKKRATDARRKIENEFLLKNGMQNVNTLDERTSLNLACHYGKLQAVSFLGVWYVRPESIAAYKKQYVEPPLPGYVLLTELCDPENKTFIDNNYSRPELGVVKRYGKLYAHPDVLATFLADYRKASIK